VPQSHKHISVVVCCSVLRIGHFPQKSPINSGSFAGNEVYCNLFIAVCVAVCVQCVLQCVCVAVCCSLFGVCV